MSEEEENRRVLGIVEYAHIEGDVLPAWCRVRPEYTALGDRWVPIANRWQEFPTEGLVYWYRPRHQTPKGSLWRLDVELLSDRARKDHWGVIADERAPAFVELPGTSDDLELRRTLSSGISPLIPSTGFAYVISLETGTSAIGPLELDRRGGDTGFLRIHSYDSDDVQELIVNGEQISVLRPTASMGRSEGLFNTQTDEQLILGVLKRLRRFNRTALEGTGITQNLLQKYVEALGTADLIGDGVLREESREKALRLLIERTDGELAKRREIANVLVSLPGMDDEFQAALRDAIRARAKEIDAEARDESSQVLARISEHKTELEELMSQLNESRAELRQSKSDLQAEKQAQSDLKENLRAHLDQEIQAIIKNPISELAKQPIVNALTSARRSTRPHTTRVSDPGSELESLQALRGALLSRVQSVGLDNDAALTCLANLCCGTPVLLAGTSAAVYSQMLGQVLSGANRRTVQMPTSVFGIDDLFHLVSVAGNAGLAPVDLGIALDESRNAESMTCVDLRGVNRAPFESGFLPLVEPVAEVDREIPWRKRDGEQSSVHIGRHVLILGTVVPGPSAFRIPYQTRGLVGLIWTQPAQALGSSSRPGKYKDHFVRVQSFVGWAEAVDAEVQKELNGELESLPHIHFPQSPQHEVAVFELVFGNRASATANWLMSRFGGIAEASLLNQAANHIGGEEAVRLIELAADDGRLDRLQKMTEQED